MENTKKISKIFGLALMTYKQRERERGQKGKNINQNFNPDFKKLSYF
jgi:hypothetical protein